jgi:hypothetical protein
MSWFPGSAVRELGRINVDFIKSSLLGLPESVWESDERRERNSNFKQVYTIWPRLMPFTNDGIFHVFENLKMFSIDFQKNCDKFHKLFEQQFSGKIVRSSIIRVRPGEEVSKHTDGTHIANDYCQRIIIPILTNPDVVFFCDGIDDILPVNYFLQEGVVYDTNGYIPHSVINNGTTTRYNFVFDFLPYSEHPAVPVKHYMTWSEEEYRNVLKLHVKKNTPELSLPALDQSDKWKQQYQVKKQNYGIRNDK